MHLLQAGVNLIYIRDFLGHADIKTTEIYAKTDTEEKRKVIENLNYDDIFWGYGDYYIRLIYYLQMNNVNILQIPAVNGVRKEGEGNSRFFHVFWQYFKEVIKLTLKIRFKNSV